MKRILLAFLALLGLAAQIAPAQARMCGVEIGAVNRAQDQARALAPAAISAIQAVPRQNPLEQHCAAQRRFRSQPVHIPAVQIGPDRALE
ncbi:MAG: hypothetical protein ABI673_00490 [Novosphingobium sp.]